MASAEPAVRAKVADAAAYRAVEHIYHSYLTGLILMLASRAGAPRAAEVVFRTFRRQQLARFLPGLKKLGLDRASACGGVRAVSLSLEPGRRREGRVCLRERQQGLGALSAAALDLVGHRDLRHPVGSFAGDAARMARQQRRRARQSAARLRLHRADRRRPAGAGRLLQGVGPRSRARGAAAVLARRDAVRRSRPISRRACPTTRGRRSGCRRSFATMRWNTSPRLCRRRSAVLGPEEGGHLAGAAARLVGMHTFDEVAALLGGVEAGAAGFAKAFARLARGQDDDAELQLEGSARNRAPDSWRLMAEREALSPRCSTPGTNCGSGPRWRTIASCASK